MSYIRRLLIRDSGTVVCLGSVLVDRVARASDDPPVSSGIGIGQASGSWGFPPRGHPFLTITVWSLAHDTPAKTPKNYMNEETVVLEKELAAFVSITKIRHSLQYPAKNVPRCAVVAERETVETTETVSNISRGKSFERQKEKAYQEMRGSCKAHVGRNVPPAKRQ